MPITSLPCMEAEPAKYGAYKAWRYSGAGRKYYSPRWAIISEIIHRKSLPSNRSRQLGDLAKDLEKERLEVKPIPLGLKALGVTIMQQRQAAASGIAAAAAPTPT